MKLQDTTTLWVNKSPHYWNYMLYNINLLVPDKDIKIIWDQAYKNDPSQVCEKFENLINPEKQTFNYFVTAKLLLFYFLREEKYFKSICDEFYVNQDPTLIKELGKMVELDQKEDRDNKVKQRKVDEQNLLNVEQIIDSIGKYPGRSIVGKELEDAAWLVIQHAPLPIIKKYASIISDAVEAHDLHPKYFAYTLDRIAMAENRPQKYGTQIIVENGSKKLHPLQNHLEVDNYRKSVGLGPLDLYMKSQGLK